MVHLQSPEKRRIRAAVPTATGHGSRGFLLGMADSTCLLAATIECAGNFHKAKELNPHVLRGTWGRNVTECSGRVVRCVRRAGFPEHTAPAPEPGSAGVGSYTL